MAKGMHEVSVKIFQLKWPKKALTVLAVLGIASICFGFVGSGTVHADTNQAIDNNSPTPNSADDGRTPNPGNFTPLTGVGQGNFNGKYMWYKIYVPFDPATQTGDATTITINQVCKDVGTPTVDYWIFSLGDNEKDNGGNQGVVPNKWTSATKTSNSNPNNNNTNCNYSPTITIKGGSQSQENGLPSTLPGHRQYRVFAFIAHLTGGSGNDERYFRLNSSDTNAFIGMASKDLTSTIPLKYSTIYKSQPSASTPDPWNASVMFAPRCDQDPAVMEANNPGSTDIKIFDPDNGLYQNNFHATLDATKSDPISWSQVKSWDAHVVQGNKSPPVANPWGLSGTTGTLSYGGYKNNGTIYKLHLLAIKWPNTIQVQLPFDQFNASIYNVKDCTQFSCTATPDYLGDPNTVQVVVTNDSPYSWGKGYQVREQYLPNHNQAYHKDPVTGTLYTEAWPNANASYPPNPSDGFSVDISPGGTATSTKYKDPIGSYYFYKSASSNVEFVLYDDVGGSATPLNWDNGGCTASTSPVLSCVGTPAIPDVEPGQTGTFSYVIKVSNPNSSAATVNFSASVTPGVYSVSATNPTSISVAGNTTKTQTVTATAQVNAQGQFIGTATSGANTVSCPVTVTPQTRPFFIVQNGDLKAGGGFADINGNCSGNFIAPSTSSPYTKDSGGVLAYSSPGTGRGSWVDYGVDALGEIYKDTTAYMGFYSAMNAKFANTTLSGTSYGGFLDANSGAAAYCVKDFYNTTRIGSPTPKNTNVDVTTLSTGQYQMPGGLNINGNSGTIGVGHQVTIYVNGDVTINGDIINTPTWSWDFTDPTTVSSSVPFLTVIAKGDIKVASNVKRIDGLFIAQSYLSGSSYTGGNFYTCDPADFCTSQLTVNGAVIAQQIKLLREHGTLCANGGCPVPYSITTGPAEVFNYTPAMVVGKPYLKQNQSLSGILDSLSSLPPVF